MRRVIVCLLGILVLGSVSANAAQSANRIYLWGSLSIPLACSFESPSGGCSSPTYGLTISSGHQQLQPCLVEPLDPTAPMAGACGISNGAGRAGAGSAVVSDPNGCDGGTIVLSQDVPSNVSLDFTGENNSAVTTTGLKVTAFSLMLSSGKPSGLGFGWKASGEFNAINGAGGSTLHATFSGDVKSAVSCGPKQTVTGFAFTLSGHVQ